jgi:uncharacterized membrane-anchored protein
MQKKQVFFIAIAFQILILTGLLAKTFYPLVIGEEIKMKATLTYGKDLFSEYGELSYAFNLIDLATLPNNLPKNAKFGYGDVFYLSIAQKGNFYEPTGIWTEASENQKFIKVILQNNNDSSDTLRFMNIKAGIESYFFTEEDFDILDNQDNREVAVNVMLTVDGKARIKAVE